MIEQGATVNGRYRVDRLIGEGGMAVVYVGHDLLLGRDVAIKALRPQYAVDPQFRARFHREAKAAAGFSHPNIVDIYDVGEQHGTPYFVMAYVPGQTLKEVVETEGPFHPDDVAGLLQQVCAALDYAHERGYVHRDVKPQNVLVDPDGHAIVVDFGIAKGLADADLTEVGTGLGTVHYLSPEQASGLMATPASDVYAAGIVAFEMLTRGLPFDADTPVGIAMRHLHERPPAPSDILPSIPPAVDAIVLRALDKDPTRRFPSAGSFARSMTYWRQYRAPAVGSGFPDPGATAPLATPVRDGSTSVLPDAAVTPPTAPPGSTPAAGRAARSGGCATWAVGLLLLAGLVGLIWLGVRLSPAIGGIGGPTATSDSPVLVAPDEEPNLVAPNETTTPEPELVILPIETPTPESPPPTTQPPPQPTIGPVEAAVPDLVGRTLAEAESLLTEEDLQAVEGEPTPSDEFPAGAVVFQEPPPGATLPPGSEVTVRLSSGPEAIDLDELDLVGQPADEAARVLGELGLAVARVEIGSPEVPEGSVAAVEPDGSALPGETVTLRVSVGNRVQIPTDIFGSPVETVARQLERLGLRVTNQYPADRETVESFGIDLDEAGIEQGDVVGIQGTAPEINFGAWVRPNAEVDLVYYDRGGGREP